MKPALAGGPRKVRLEGDGPIVVLHGAGRVPFPVVGQPAVGVSARVIRLELDPPVECSAQVERTRLGSVEEWSTGASAWESVGLSMVSFPLGGG